MRFFRNAIKEKLGATLLVCVIAFFSLFSAAAGAAVTVTPSFTPNSIYPGNSSNLTIQFANDSANSLLSSALTINLPSGMTIYSTPGVTDSCSFSGSATAGGTQIVLTGGTIPDKNTSGGQCSYSVNVTSVSVGGTNLVFSIPLGTFAATDDGQSIANLTDSNVTLSVSTISNPTTSVSFSPTSVWSGEDSRLTITISNPNASVNLPLTSFNFNLPSGLKVSSNSLPTTSSCTGTGAANGTVSTVADSTSLSLAGGTVGISGSCSIVVYVYGPGVSSSTSYSASVSAGGFGNTRGLTSQASGSSSLTVKDPLSISQSLSTGSTKIRSGFPTTLTIQFTNNSSVGSVTAGSAFVEQLPSGLVIDPSLTPSVSCTGAGTAGSLDAQFNTGLINWTGGEIAPSASCTITLAVKSTAKGAYTISSTASGSSSSFVSALHGLAIPAPASSVNLTTYAGFNVTKSVSDTSIYPGQSFSYTIQVDNYSAADAVITSLVDSLPTSNSVQVILDPNLSAAEQVVGDSGCGTTAPSFTGTSTITISNLTVLAGAGTSPGTCNITLNVQLPSAAVVGGSYQNSISASNLSSSIGNEFSGSVTSTSSSVISSLGVCQTYSSSSSKNGCPSTSSSSVSSNSSKGSAYLGDLVNFYLILNNPTNADITNAALSYSLASNLLLQSVTPTSSGCGSPSFSLNTVTNTISITGMTISKPSSGNANGICKITFSSGLKANALGTLRNTIAGSSVTDTNNITNVQSNSFDLTVSNPLSISQSFSPASTNLYGTSTLTMTLSNASQSIDLTGVSVNNVFPTGSNAFVLASNPSVSTTCTGSPSYTASSGSTNFLISGLTVPKGTSGNAGSCRVSFTIYTTAGGPWTDTLLASNISANETGVGINTSNSSLSATLGNSISGTAAFSPSSVAIGGTSLLTLTLTNGGVTSFSNVALTTPLPTGLQVANSSSASSTCQGSPIITANSGASSVTTTGARIPAGGSCAISFYVSAVSLSSGSTWTFSQPVGSITSLEGATNSAAITASLTKITGSLAINKSFTPVQINGGQPSVLEVDLTAPASAAVNAVSFTDSFPNGMEVYSVPSASTTCTNATVTAVPGSTAISISGADMTAAQVCKTYVTVTSVKPLSLINVIPVGAVSSRQGFTNGSAASATLSTLQGVGLEKSFYPTAISSGQTSLLTIKVVSTVNEALTNLQFTDNLPDGMTVATSPNATTSCTGGTVSATAGGNGFSLSGVSLSAQSNCTVSLNVTASTVGSYTNTIAANAVTTTQTFSNGSAASATLYVMRAPTVAISFATSPIVSGGNSVMRVTVTNADNTTDLTNLSLSSLLPSGLTVYSTPGTSTTCTSGSVQAISGGNSVSITGATLNKSASCYFQVSVTGYTPGSYIGTVASNAISDSQGISNTAGSTSTLIVLDFPTIGHSFSASNISSGGTATWSIALGNPNSSSISLSSNLVINAPANISLTSSPTVNKGTCTGSSGSGTANISASASTSSVTLSTSSTGVGIPAGGCTVVVSYITGTVVGGPYSSTINAGALVTSAGSNQAPSTAYISVYNTTPPTANSFTQNFSTSSKSPVSVTSLSGSATSPSTVATYSVMSIPSPSLGKLYCNGTQILPTANFPVTCDASLLTFEPLSSGSATWTYKVTDSAGLTSLPATVTFNVTSPPVLAFVKSATSSVLAGQNVTYTFVITNTGQTASGLSATLSESLPSGMTLTAITPITGISGVSCGSLPISTSSFNCTVTFSSAIQSGASASFQMTATAPSSAGVVTNYASIDSTGGSSPPAPGATCTSSGGTATTCSSASTTVTTPASFTLVKTGPSIAGTSSAMIYTFTIGNSGSNSSGLTATVKDLLPAGVVATSVSAGSGVAAVDCGTLPSAAGATLNCSVALSNYLAGGSTAAFTITATAPSAIPSPASIVNYASIDPTGGSSPPTPAENCTTSGGTASTCTSASTTIALPASFTLAKSATSPSAGSETFTFKIGNSGGVTSGTFVTLKDSLPAGMSVTSISVVSPNTGVSSVSCTDGTNTLTNSSGATLSAGSTITCTVTLSTGIAAGIANTDPTAPSFSISTASASGDFTNYASLDSTGANTPPTPGASCTPVASCASVSGTVPGFKIVKSASPSSLSSGSQVTYTFNIYWIGSGSAATGTTVKVNELFPTGLSSIGGATAVTGISGISGCSSFTANTAKTCTVTLSSVLNSSTLTPPSFRVTATASPSFSSGVTTTNLTNYATIATAGGSATPPSLPTSSCTDNSCSSATITVNSPANFTLAKSQTSSATVTTGAQITYQVSLGNSGGTASGTSFTVKDQLPSGVIATAVTKGANVATISCVDAHTHTLPTASTAGDILTCTGTLTSALAAGSVNGGAVFTITATAPSSSGSITNYANVGPTGGAPSAPTSLNCTDTSCGSVSTTVNTPASFSLTKTASASTTTSTSLTYTLRVTNDGQTASGATATVSELLPANVSGISYSSSTTAGTAGTISCSGLAANTTGTCTLTFTGGSLAAAAYSEFTITVTTPSSSGSITNYASVAPTTGGTAPTPGSGTTCTSSTNGSVSTCKSAATTVNPPSNFSLLKAATTKVMPSGQISYTLTLSQSGAGTSGLSATVLDKLPAGVVATAVTSGSGVSSVSCNDGSHTLPVPSTAAALLTCTVNLSSGLVSSSQAVFTITATAPSATGLITNYASVEPAGGLSPVTPSSSCTATYCANAQTSVTTPSLVISKSGPNTLPAGALVSYAVTIQNSGDLPTTGNVSFTDSLPTGLTYVNQTSGSSSLVCSASNPSNTLITCSGTPNIAANGGSLTVTYTVNVSPSASGNLINQTQLVSLGGDARAPPVINSALDPTGITSTTGVGTQSTDQLAAKYGAQVVTGTLSVVKTLSQVSRGTPLVALTSLAGYSVRPDDVLSYQLAVSNSSTASNVASVTTTLTETVPANTLYDATTAGTEGWLCSSGYDAGKTCTQDVTVGSGSTVNKLFTVRVLPAASLGSGVTSIDNTVTMTGNTGTCTTCSVSTSVVPRLRLAKSGPANLPLGGLVNYTVTLSNVGGTDTTGVAGTGTITFTDTLPTGLSFNAQTSGTGMTCSAAGQLITCTGTPVIAKGNSLAIGYSVKVASTGLTSGANLINSAVFTALGSRPVVPSSLAADPTGITSTTGVGTQSTDQLAAKYGAQVVLSTLDTKKTISLVSRGGNALATTDGYASYTVQSGDVITYNLAVTNNSTTASSATLLGETVPLNTTFDVTAIGNNGWICSGSPTGTVYSALSACTKTVNVTSGVTPQLVNVPFTVKVLSLPLDGSATSITNTVTSSVGGCSACSLMTSVGPRVRISKSGPAYLTPNNIATYTVTLKNDGGSPTAGTVTFTDTLPAGLTYVAQTAGNPMSCNAAGQLVTCTSANPLISAGASLAVTYTVTVSPTLTVNAVLTNQALVTQLGNYAVSSATALTGLGNPAAGAGSVSTNQLAANWASSVTVAIPNIPPATPPAATVITKGNPVVMPPPPGIGGTIQTISLPYPPSSGTATLDPSTGKVSFVPVPNFVGQVTIQLTVIDGSGKLITTTYTIDVIDPAGIVYNSVTRLPVPGVKVEILDANGILLANQCLSPSTPNGPITQADGRYELLLSTNPACQTTSAALFKLRVTNPQGYKPGFSVAIPPQANAYTSALGGGIEFIQRQDAPPQGAEPTTYYDQFMFVINSNAQLASNGVGQNHIPIDPIDTAGQGFLSLSKVGSAKAVEIGDSIQYTLTLNYSAKLGTTTENNVVIRDVLPLGFKYIPNSVMVTHGSSKLSGDQSVGLVGQGPELLFNLGAMTSTAGAADSIVVTYRVRVGVGAQNGTGINLAVARSANGLVSNEARFKVETTLGVFAQEGCIVGKVYLDCNGNGIQDQEDGVEPGVGGVRLYTEDGTFMVSDPYGAYSICGVSPMTHMLKLDKTTLPIGAHLGISANRNANDPDSIFVDMKFGELHRADFIINNCSEDLLGEIAKRSGKSVPLPKNSKKPVNVKTFSSKEQKESGRSIEEMK